MGKQTGFGMKIYENGDKYVGHFFEDMRS